MREFGYSSDEVLKITEAVSTGLKLSGANTQEASSVITQFSQALAQGVLRGEEFNAVNEAGDRVIRALAAGMGVARKDLKSMADQGQLTIDKVVPALMSQLGSLQGEFASMPQTVSGSLQKVTNSFMAWVGGVNQATGATDALSGGLDNVMADASKAVAESLRTLDSSTGGNTANVTDLSKTLADFTQVSATQINSLKVTVNGQSAAIIQNSQVSADINNNLNAMYSIKVAVDSNGNQYAAGMGIGVQNTPSGMQTQVIFVADRFAVMTKAGGAVTLPFVIQNGQTIIRDTVIGDGTIGNAKIGSYIQSSTWDGTGNVGWHINKSGYATFNNVTVRGSIYATNGNFSFNGSGNTTVINGNGVTINIPGGGRIVLGTWT